MRFRVLCSNEDRRLPVDVQESVGEIRLKKRKLPLELINSVRRALLLQHTGPNKDKLMEEEPVDIKLELQVLSMSCNLLKEFYFSRYKTNVKDDRRLLASKVVVGRLRFAVIHRLEAKDIIISNINLMELLMKILIRIHQGENFKLAYLNKVDMLETDPIVNTNRRALRFYLKSLYYNSQAKDHA